MQRLMPLFAAAALVLSTTSARADLGDQLAKLLPDDGTAGDTFGISVAISETTAVVGALYDDDNGTWSGSVYLFDTTTGQQITKLLPDDGAAGDRFGNSAAISGTTAIVGAFHDGENGPHSGSAYLFDTTTGQQIAKLLPEDGGTADDFGVSVGISGTTAVVGAWTDDDNGTNSGSAYLFDTTTGQLIAKLLPDDAWEYDRFGWSVAISGGIAIVTAPWDGDNGDDSGSAYLFDTTTGQQITKLLPDDGAAYDWFGTTVAISGTIAIVGTPRDDDACPDNSVCDSGSAYLFDAITGQQIAKLLPDDGEAGDAFGYSVAISGATAIVGAYLDDDACPGDPWCNSGSAYLFDTATGQQIAKLLPEDGAEEDHFGYPVAISGATAIVGAYEDDDNGTNSGSAYLFDADGASPCPGDFDGDGTVGASDLAVLLGYWGLNPSHPADLDADGSIGAADLAILLGNWGPCPEIVCLDPKMDPTDLNCQASAECNIDGAIIVYDLFECYCLEGVAEEQCCDAILQSFEESCESSGGVLEGSFCNCFP